MDNDLISIIVPAYKCEKYIEKCIQSVINQDYTNFELIIVLDGVFDNSEIICNKYADSNNRIKVIKIENQGVSVARNTGLENAKGKWVAFIDSDDWIESNFLSALIQKAEENNPDVVICDYYTDYKSEIINSHFFATDKECSFKYSEQTQLIEACLVKNSLIDPQSIVNIGVPWAKLYNADFLKENSLLFVPKLDRMQDTIFNLYAFKASKRITYFRKNLYHYTKNEESSTVGYRPNFEKTIKMFMNELNKFNTNNGNIIRQKIIYAKKIALLNELIKLKYVSTKSDLSFGKKIKEIKSFIEEYKINRFDYRISKEYLSKKQVLTAVLCNRNCITPLLILTILKEKKDKNKWIN